MKKVQTQKSMKLKMNIVLGLLIIVGFCSLIGRLYYLQLVDYEENRTRAMNQQLRPTTITAQRGVIYDRNMKTLAASATVWTVTISPAEISSEADLNKIADFLSELLEVNKQMIIDRGQKKASYYEIIKTRVGKAVADEINTFILDNKIKGINLVESTRRYYPYGNLASTVLGFTTIDNNGAYGLEAYYDKTLAGTPGLVVAAKNAKSGDMPFSYEKEYEPIDGNSLILTIDEVIQHSLERNLETAVVEHSVRNRAVAIAMDVNTGAILGMTTKNDFDPNNPNEVTDPASLEALEEMELTLMEEFSYITDAQEREKAIINAQKKALSDAQFEQWRNKAISDPYEPGSVFKIITAAMALDLEVTKPTGQYYTCTGYHVVAGRKKGCWKTAGHGTINFTEAVKYSCNPAFMMVGAAVGARNFYDYFDRFGLMEPTGIDLPGEAEGIFYDYATLAKETGEELASSSFGQTFKVTPLQVCAAVAATVNGGKLMQPYIVSQVVDINGNVVSTTEPTVKRQVITEETSTVLTGILERVVADSDGSGRFAYVPGFRVGGKTGTSEKLDAKDDGEVSKRISSFLGVAPCDDPQVLVLVILDEPYMENAYGSVIAAPVVGAIMADILPYMNIDTKYTESEMALLEVEVPNTYGSLVHDAIAQLTIKELKYKIAGNGTTVIRTLPAKGDVCPKGSTVILYTDESALENSQVTVPNVVGSSAQQANRVLLNSGLNIKIEGDVEATGSVAITQDPPSGSQCMQGSIVTVYFETDSIEG